MILARKGPSFVLSALFIAAIAPAALAQTGEMALRNTFGMPGIIDLPHAAPLADAELVTTVAGDESKRKYTLTFQITPRLTAAFRYTIVDNYRGRDRQNFDRSFDVQYQLVDEGRIRPAIAVGLRDFIGTGLFSSEYVVASKQVTPQINATAGIGWGALATRDGFNNPLSGLDDGFGQRPGFSGLGGEASSSQWFRGDAAVFAGLTWQVTDKLSAAAEYSTDAVNLSSAAGRNEDAFPLNFGLRYALQPGIVFGAQYLQGGTFGATAEFSIDPRNAPAGGDLSPAPVPFALRGGSAQSWAGPVIHDAIPDDVRPQALAAGLAAEGIILQGIAQTADTVVVRIRNTRFDIAAQAIGRTARLLALTMPATVDVFAIELVENDVPLSRVTLRRSDLERLEYQSGFIAESLDAAEIGAPQAVDGLSSLASTDFTWGIGPYLGLGLFDPDDPLRADLGIEATASYTITPGLSVSGALRAKVVGNRDESTREANSVLPPVRSDQSRYDSDGTFGIEQLTIDHYGRIGDDIYTRASFGYLEEMFGGASGEILWKPVDSRFGLGAEMNVVMQRDTDKLFGFDDYDYRVATGHVSAYYALQNGFDLQVDVGRYLAGDWGTTISLDRRFGNGWVVGGFATFTDVSFEDFGEGSFDKGIRVVIPMSWALGQPSRDTAAITLRPIQRDGGARLNLDNRLYPVVRGAHAPELSDQWGRFWR